MAVVAAAIGPPPTRVTPAAVVAKVTIADPVLTTARSTDRPTTIVAPSAIIASAKATPVGQLHATALFPFAVKIAPDVAWAAVKSMAAAPDSLAVGGASLIKYPGLVNEGSVSSTVVNPPSMSE
jgi:hypothetical protein